MTQRKKRFRLLDLVALPFVWIMAAAVAGASMWALASLMVLLFHGFQSPAGLGGGGE